MIGHRIRSKWNAIRHCIKDYARETKWLGFIDIDEFIVPKSKDSIYEFLRLFENKAGAVNLYWKLFGTSGKMDRDLSGLVCEDFTVCWPKYCDIGKCFYNTAFGLNFDPSTQSSFIIDSGLIIKEKIFLLLIYLIIFVLEIEILQIWPDFPIQINHYFTKSYKE